MGDRYRFAFDAANVGKSLTRVNGELFVNQAFCEMLGYAQEELQARRWQDITPREDIPRIETMLSSLHEGERDSLRFETRYLHKNGSEVWADVSVVLARDEQQKPLFYITTAIDITARKRDERSLHILRQGMEHACLGIYQIAEDATILYANRYVAESLGYAPEELIGMSLFDIDPSFDAASFAAHRRVTRMQGSRTITTTHQRRDGSTFPVEVTVHYFDFEGASYTYSFIKDISARMEAEQALRANEALQRALIDAAPVAIVSLDRDGNVLKWNAEAERMFGWSEEEVRGRPIPIVTPEQQEEFAQLRKRVWNGEMLRKLELHRMRKDGTSILVQLSTAPIHADDGSIRGIISVFDDITEAKRNEMEIIHLNTELEQRVRDRTEKLEQSNIELEAFSSSVSHDLRVPLRHIIGYIDLLQGRFASDLPEKAHHYLDTVAESAKDMGTLIDDVLQFSHTSRQELRHEQVDMNELVEEVRTDLLESEESQREIRWQIDTLPVVEGDRSLLALVWINLLGNALKFTRRNEVTHIAVTSRTEPESRSYVFTVRDNGVGFDMKYANRLFGVFQRLHGPDEFPGTGIGLANVHRIIQRHNGRTWAEGEPDQGAAFSFTLPASDGRA